MKKIASLCGVLVLFISLSSAALYIPDEEDTQEQSSWLEYIWPGLSFFQFDGLIDFRDALPDLRPVFGIRTEPYSAEEIEQLGLR